MPQFPHLSVIVKPCPDVSWDPGHTAVHKVIHKDILFPAVDGSQFGRLPPNGELRAVEVSLGPSLIEREKSIAVAFELHP